jgi:hypothetical protein
MYQQDHANGKGYSCVFQWILVDSVWNRLKQPTYIYKIYVFTFNLMYLSFM